jgi:hypothetical protein
MVGRHGMASEWRLDLGGFLALSSVFRIATTVHSDGG